MLELLSVLALLSAVTAAVLPGAGLWAQDGSPARLEGMLREVDQRARAFARTTGGAVLKHDSGRHLLTLRGLKGEAGLVLERRVPSALHLELKTKTRRDSVLYASDGSCSSWTATARSEEKVAQWSISGATGWMERVR